MRWCADMIHDGVNQGLELLDLMFSKVLVQVVGLTLPVSNAISMQNFLDLGAYFHLSLITDKLSGGSPCPDLVLECVDALPVSLNGINICNGRLHTNENLGNGGY